MSILSFHNLSQSFGANDIFAGLHATVPPKAKIGLVGANGIGKTTLLRLLAGQHKPKSGGIHLAKGTTVGYLQQEAMHAFRQPQNSVYAEMLGSLTTNTDNFIDTACGVRSAALGFVLGITAISHTSHSNCELL